MDSLVARVWTAGIETIYEKLGSFDIVVTILDSLTTQFYPVAALILIQAFIQFPQFALFSRKAISLSKAIEIKRIVWLWKSFKIVI